MPQSQFALCVLLQLLVYRLCVLSYFVFLGYALRRHIHSFPTRRSSDLILEPIFAAALDSAWGAPGGRLQHRHPRVLVGHVDRKSTRLNSSHGYISYAVFCLKKKINPTALFEFCFNIWMNSVAY